MGVLAIVFTGTNAGIGIVCRVWKCYEKCHEKKLKIITLLIVLVYIALNFEDICLLAIIWCCVNKGKKYEIKDPSMTNIGSF